MDLERMAQHPEKWTSYKPLPCIPIVPIPKSYENHIEKNQLLMCLPPTCFDTGFGFVSGFELGYSRNFQKKIKIDEVIGGGKIPALWIVTTIVLVLLYCSTMI